MPNVATGVSDSLRASPGRGLLPSGLPLPRRSCRPRRSSAAMPTTRRSSATRSTTSRGWSCSTTAARSRRFVDRLRERYGDVATLSDRWGLVYWSHRLSRWDDLWVPDGNTVPSYDLAWRRFQSALTTEFISAQAAIVERAGARRPVRHDVHVACHAPRSIRADLNRDARHRRGQPVLPDAGRAHGARAPARGRAGAPALERAGRGLGDLPPGRPDARRARRAVPRHRDERDLDRRAALELPRLRRPVAPGGVGARLPWRADGRVLALALDPLRPRGVLARRAQPRRRARALLRRGQADRRRLQRAAGSAVADLVPDADVGVLYSRESRWAMEFQPPLALEGSLEADTGSYERIFGRFYEGLFGAGLQADIVYPQQLGSDADDARGPLAGARRPGALRRRRRAAGSARRVRAGRRTSRARLSQRLRRRRGAAARRRSCRAGCARRWGRATASTRTSPSRCRCVGAGEGFALPEGAAATAWADALVPEGAESLVGYEHPHLGRWAAVTTHAHGRGRVTYVGTLPDRSLAVALARWLRPEPDALGGPARDRHGHERPQRRRGAAALRVELVLGTDELGAAGGGARPAVRDRPRTRRGRWSWRRGMSGCFWRAPRGENNEEESSS